MKNYQKNYMIYLNTIANIDNDIVKNSLNIGNFDINKKETNKKKEDL